MALAMIRLYGLINESKQDGQFYSSVVIGEHFFLTQSLSFTVLNE
jgi:hypothetical protein